MKEWVVGNFESSLSMSLSRETEKQEKNRVRGCEP